MNKKNMSFKIKRLSIYVVLSALMCGGIILPQLFVESENVQAEQSNQKTEKIVTDSTKWKYFGDGSDPAAGLANRSDWTLASFNDSAWSEASGLFGHKSGNLVSLGSNYGRDFTPTILLANKYDNNGTSMTIPTYFFRTKVNIDSLEDLTSLSGRLYYDDAAIVYINGKKVVSFSEPEGGYETNLSYGGSNMTSPLVGEFSISASKLSEVLVKGENTISIELHQGRNGSSDVYLEVEKIELNYNEKILQSGLSLSVGSDESEVNVSWQTDHDEKGVVQVAKKTSETEFPTQYDEFSAVSKETSVSGNYYHQATITGLEKGKEYVYRLVNGSEVSSVYELDMQDTSEEFNFLFVGDPQIGSSNTLTDTQGWAKTLNEAVSNFNPSFIVSGGDQVNTASNESEYAGYLNHDELFSLPAAQTIGNHDSSSVIYQEHFNLPNEEDGVGTTAGTDYYYVYENTLFMHINTNVANTATHKAFLEKAIEENKDVQWKVVVFHHSIYSAASHAEEASILSRREALVPVFDELDIDVVLMGHDHVYVRTYMMNGFEADDANGIEEEVLDAEGIVYVTANSASGSKYYDLKAKDFEYAAVKRQDKTPTVSNIKVSDESFEITTYLVNDMSVIDTFKLSKTVEKETEEDIDNPDEEDNDNDNSGDNDNNGSDDGGQEVTPGDESGDSDGQIVKPGDNGGEESTDDSGDVLGETVESGSQEVGTYDNTNKLAYLALLALGTGCLTIVYVRKKKGKE